MTLLQLLSALGTGAGIIFAGARWLIGVYYKKALEVEELRRASMTEDIDALKHENKDLKASMTMFKRDFDEFRVEFARQSEQVKHWGVKAKEIQEQWAKTSTQLEERYRAMEQAEMIKVGKDTFILRTPKRP